MPRAPEEPKEVDVLGNRIMVSNQARMAFWGYVIVFLCIVGISLLNMGKAFFTPNGLLIGIVSAVFLAAFMLVGLYILNCTVIGQCHTIAWVITALVIFNAVLYVTMFLVSVFALLRKK